jgi:hypothetical protein
MFTRSKIALFAALILAAAPAVLAKDGALPKLDAEKLCRAEVASTYGGTATTTDFDSCVTDEQAARDQLAKDWATYPALAREKCVQAIEYLPSYIEWLTCVEMDRDVLKTRKEQAASAPPASKARGANECPVIQTRDDGSIVSVIAC